ncbi:hypothetical protein NDU88_004321 [Pleurodeles waltl]|uniref:Uncharacterized protein n=1 Tax=Pleurodeles waltl TaxID=8319 RepID=A0AAV7SIH5_PLEWA|nr:hypothetical protein NDU88_004321 [Pleurodeles waltl]
MLGSPIHSLPPWGKRWHCLRIPIGTYVTLAHQERTRHAPDVPLLTHRHTDLGWKGPNQEEKSAGVEKEDGESGGMEQKDGESSSVEQEDGESGSVEQEDDERGNKE